MRAIDTTAGLPGWDRLRHGGLLLDGTRLAALARAAPAPLDAWTARELRRRASALLDGGADAASFVAFVLEQVCGLDVSTGAWTRGSQVSPDWGRCAVTGETVKPRQLWQGRRGARVPVFLDDGGQLGIGRSRRNVSRVLGWLRAGGDPLALVTNGRQWRLVFAGLDHDAWCEWDLELWFEEGDLSPQVTALRTLLQARLWTPAAEGAEPPLLQAIRDTRKGQAKLSEELGERVREAVEILIRAHGAHLSSLGETARPAEIYRAACRVAMRLVVILFAESRDLLPRDNPLYHESYGLHSLLERLERAAARGRNLAGSFGAWHRVLALFALVREGSHHPDLPVTAYGGALFAPGARDADDEVSRALRVYEQTCFEQDVLPDRDVHEMLTYLTRTTMRIHQGRSSIRVAVPVDFSDLSSEYIGILYEGLLDYELKTAPKGDPVVFLSVGDQPALPLSRLEAMDDRALRSLFERLKEKPGATDDRPDDLPAADAAPETDATDTENDASDAARSSGAPPSAPAAEAAASAAGAPEPASPPDERGRNRTRAELWARRAVQAGGLLPKPRGRDTPERRLAFESRLAAKARQLVARVVLPGEWYLVRWGGTRKGSGSFYTRSGLAVPIVQRTLGPLAYDPPANREGRPDPDAPPAHWKPKRPERILALTVCDPACGSGTFLLAALRFLTDALYAALQYYDRLRPDGDRVLVRLLGLRGATDDDEDDRLADELIPCRSDDDQFEPRLKAVLRRQVVERCLYAVDLDPLAVELCRLSLWIETLDRSLPFGFLDHKIQCGNALVGAWFDQFAHYPVMAWKNRDGGDSNHANGVHFEQNARTKAIKAFVRDRLTPDLKRFLSGADLFSPDLLAQSAAAHDGALAVLERMHALPVHDAAERARLYRDELAGSSARRALQDAMDLWCACWFWPVDAIEHAPLPSAFADPPDETRAVARRVAAEMRFFHWELAFPDVFRQAGSGFDAMLGNPPWDIAKPVSMEFFSNLDPLYRSYGKQEALDRQTEYFADPDVERGWLDYGARFRAQSNFMSHARSPFGDPDECAAGSDRFAVARGRTNQELHARWRNARARPAGFADAAHPFRHQGSADLNLYKLFLELAHALLKPPTQCAADRRTDTAARPDDRTADVPAAEATDSVAAARGGRLGFLVPSGLYSDHGTGALRDLFLERCRWEWLFGFENRDKIFPIDSRFKFNPVVIEKGGTTAAVHTVFMRRNPDDWARAEELAIPYTLARIKRFSPKSHALLEIQSPRDLEILEKIYAHTVLLGDDGPDGWGIRYTREFDMTNDSKLFPPRPQWEAQGYRPDEYSRWLRGDWRPIEQLWEELGVDPSQPATADIALEDSLFDTTAGPKRRNAEVRFVHGHRLKPGDVARTDWRARCAQPPYDRLPVPRAALPPGVLLSREGDAWVREEEVRDVALPLYEGRMIGQCDFSQKGWVKGKGRQAEWRNIPWERKQIEPQFLMAQQNYSFGSASERAMKLALMDITSSTNTRTVIASTVPDFPCGNKAPVLQPAGHDSARTIELASITNTLAFDWTARQHLSGITLNWYILEALPLPVPGACSPRLLAILQQLSLSGTQFAPEQLAFSNVAWRRYSRARSPVERLRMAAVVDAVVAAIFRFSSTDMRHVLRECDEPVINANGKSPKGFWRVDRDKPPELRHTVLTLVAFDDLQAKIDAAGGDRDAGIEAFLTQNDGEGWLLPETLRLADHGLGHDERAREPQPVAGRLGPRFYDWQLVQGADESRRECHLHARNLLGAHGYALRIVDVIAQRMADGEDWRGLLTDPFTRDLTGADGCVTVLAEIRARDILYESAFWSLVEDLRGAGHLDDDGHGRLLDQLHARELLDEVGYRRRGGRAMPATDVGTSAQRVAETGPGGQPELFPTRRQ